MSLKDDIQAKGFHSEQEKSFVNLIYTAALFEANFNKFIKPFGVSSQQYNVLRILRGQFPNSISSGDLHSRMIHKMSNASRLVDKLVEKGYVIRVVNANDKRNILVSITDLGLRLVIDLDKEVAAFQKTSIDLPSSKLKDLNLILDELRSSLG
ncbi:MarR family transcriptional regulator [Flavobacteriales bacterium]|nr:MarR family transcriptional regulator [Flavobacteriales bacterium]MDB2653123.1 MarR family transcriptional regulator [Flavobacteriales bacterium]